MLRLIRWLARWKWPLLAFVTFSITLTVYLTWGTVQGIMDARRDCDAGDYQIAVYGMPPPWQKEAEKLLKDRYGHR
ncbi:hypothetical protein BH11PLA2_BH11PLA2_13520 [soil metagenome]